MRSGNAQCGCCLPPAASSPVRCCSSRVAGVIGADSLRAARAPLRSGVPCFRGYGRRNGERRRKSVRGCIVSQDLAVMNLVIVKHGACRSHLPRRWLVHRMRAVAVPHAPPPPVSSQTAQYFRPAHLPGRAGLLLAGARPLAAAVCAAAAAAQQQAALSTARLRSVQQLQGVAGSLHSSNWCPAPQRVQATTRCRA